MILVRLRFAPAPAPAQPDLLVSLAALPSTGDLVQFVDDLDGAPSYRVARVVLLAFAPDAEPPASAVRAEIFLRPD